MFKGKVGMFVMVAFKVAGLELPQLLVAVTNSTGFKPGNDGNRIIR